jgi:hypothetical protein
VRLAGEGEAKAGPREWARVYNRFFHGEEGIRKFGCNESNVVPGTKRVMLSCSGYFVFEMWSVDRIGAYVFAHDHAVIRQPALPLCKTSLNVEPVSLTGLPCLLKV